jgi:hypothetical protein
MFRRILRYSTKMRFDDVIAVKEGHFTIGFYPDLKCYQRCIQVDKISQSTLNFAYCANQSSALTCNMNLPLLVNLPKQVPSEIRFGLATEIAMRMQDSET